MQSTFSKEIPLFFSVDDNYLPFLDVTLRSIIQNSSKDNSYHAIILNTGLDSERSNKVKALECENFRIEFVDISDKIANVKSKLRDIYHYSLATYYRLFIPSLFPQFSKIIYLDADTIVLDDIAKLYDIDLEGNILAGANDQFVTACDEFRFYTQNALGVNAKNYINAGVLLIDLEKFREEMIEEKFLYLLNTYNFDSVAPDQDYLNFLCKGKILPLSTSWNKMPIPTNSQERPSLVHFNLYKKPWQYDDVYNGQYFWQYAKLSPFYEEILEKKNAFTDEDKAKKDADGIRIKEHAIEIATSSYTFYKMTKFARA